MSQQFASRREILQNWNPEDKGFWESYGKTIAKENLIAYTGFTVFLTWFFYARKGTNVHA